MMPESVQESEVVELRDGLQVHVRPIQPEDAPRLQAFHAQLSPETVYLRWLSAHPVLTDEEAADLSQLDYHQRMAFVAILPEAAAEIIIGVARYAVVEDDQPGVAEAAVVVADAYQRRGLGTVLIRRLMSYARSHGITTWVAEINAENARMLRFIKRAGFPTTKRLESGSWQLWIDIS